MTSLCVKFQPSSTPPSDRFWWGVLVLLVLLLLLLLVTGVKQSQLLVLRLSLEFDNIRKVNLKNQNRCRYQILSKHKVWSKMFPPKPFTKWSIFTPSMFLISTVSYPYFLTDDGKDTYTPPWSLNTFFSHCIYICYQW